ncbi:oxygen-regulated protein 1-like [Oncorhynchus keta]|uniref:oxygen-regulated protein 1-like n=1 Tax=Oncorhynchus keta TaxID=8018 RepID=UPI00227C5BA8|nr:oxygen-regulated protein 1-like [Oncorhynchus keta]
MSSTPLHEQEAQVLQQGGGQGGEVVPSGSVASRPPQPHSDPQASRRVCFYKSGDPQFGGHRMVINARTFKTFDALLDALSKKVPLPFGVRTITTPRGSHPVRGLEELQNGGSYVCSDQRKVKPLNLDMANRRQPPWNTTTRPVSGGRRAQRGSRAVPGDINRPADSRIRTPKRLIVFKNRDPSVRRTVVLQRRTAPTYDALLDYLSVIMQFPVLKLYTPDGSRVEGLPALILCSGVVVASGNEPFRPGNYDFLTQPAAALSFNSDSIEPTRLKPLTENKTSLSSGRRSRNFSLSSERYFVNQINKSVNDSSNGQPVRLPENMETELNRRKTRGSIDMETETYQLVEDNGKTSIVPQDDDIEKSFRVNQDGSMTVEMKVRLTIKEEEMIHWTTTLSRSSVVTNRKLGAKSVSTPQSPDNNVEAKDPNIGLSEDETKESNHPSRNAERDVAFSGTDGGGTDSGGGGRAGSLKAHPRQKRMPTPGLRQVKKKQASVESVTTVTETGVQETSLGTFSYTECMADGETTEGYCVVRQSSSSSRLPAIPPVPKPRKSGSAGASRAIRTSSHSSLRSSGVAEVMQIQNNGNGREITETVMHIYERRQSSYDNYYANALGAGYGICGEGGGGYAGEAGYGGGCGGGSSSIPRSKPASSDSGPRSSVDLTRPSSTSDSLNQQRDEILSLSSEPTSPSQNVTLPFKKQPEIISNKLSSFPDNEAYATSESYTGSSPKETEWPEPKYVENWLQNIAPESIPYVPYMEEGGQDTEETEPRTKVNMEDEGQDTGEAEPRTKVIFQIGADSEVESEVKSDYPEDQHLPQGGDHLSVGGMSMSCLSVPVSYAEAQVDLSNPQRTRKLCSSMPSVRIDPVEQQNRLGLLHRSASFVPHPVEHSESSSSTHHLLIPKATLTPIFRQLCSSIQCIRQASQPPASLEKSHSMPDFSSQVSSVFGSSSKALMSFLSVSTLKDTLSSALGKGGGGEFCRGNSNSGSEALLVMQSLQKISTMEDEEQQRASLASLQSQTSDQLKDSWRDFQERSSEMGDRESPPLSPSTNQEFALDVESEAGDENGGRLGIEELMEELNMPQELRDEVSSLVEGERTVQYAMRSPMLGGSVSDMSYAVDTEVDKVECDEIEELEVFEEDVKKIPDNWPGEEKEGEEVEMQRKELAEKEEEGEGEEDEEEREEVGEEVVESEDKRSESDFEEGRSVDSHPSSDNKVCSSGRMLDEVCYIEERGLEEEGVEKEEDQGSCEEQNYDEGEQVEEEEGVEKEEDQGSCEEQNYDEGEQVEEEEEAEVGSELSMSRKSIKSLKSDNSVKSEKSVMSEKSMKSVNSEKSMTSRQSVKSDKSEVDCKVSEHEEGDVVSNNSSSRAIYLCGVKDQGLDTSNELKTDEGEEDEDEEEEVRGKDCSHPVEISQELLDFVNTALKSSSLMFTYDPKGNLRIEPEGATRVVHTKQMFLFNGCVDSQYGLKRLPSPNTSDLSDYRPETSSSGGYKTQGSVDMSTESGDQDKEEAGRHSPGFPRIRQTSDKQSKASTTSLELWASKPSSEMKVDQLRSPESLEGKRPTGSFESCHSKVCGESLSSVSGSSSVKTEPGPELVRMIDQGRWLFKEGDSPEVGGAWQSAADSKSLPDSSEGVLIDQGRWLLKENHLIRKSPPVPMGMYGNLDNTSVDTTLSEEAPAYNHLSSTSLYHHHHLNPLSVLSSSELEELARPPTPKCTYYNMSHSSDSDPFLDNLSLNENGARERSEGKDQGLQGRSKRETAVDTSRTWARKNGSMSSFASVEFRMRDGRVHPEGELGGSEAAVEPSSRTAVGMSGRSRALQVQSSLESLRCGPYCPIL